MRNSEIAKIVEKVWQNKEEHAEEFLGAIWKTIYYITYKKLQDHQEAEDLTQEVVIYIYTHIEELKTAEAFNSWMNTVVFGFCYRKVNKISKINLTTSDDELLDLQEDEGNNPEEIALEKEQQDLILEIIDGLSKKQKDVVLLFYYQKLPMAHIAQILGCSENAIKSRLYNAREAIKVSLEEKKNQKGIQLRSINLTILLPFIFMKEEQAVCSSSIYGRLKLNLEKQEKSVLSSKKAAAAVIISILFIITGISAIAVIHKNGTVSSRTESDNKGQLSKQDTSDLDSNLIWDNIEAGNPEGDSSTSDNSNGEPADEEPVTDRADEEPVTDRADGNTESQPAGQSDIGADGNSSGSKYAGSSTTNSASNQKYNEIHESYSSDINSYKPEIYIANNVLYYSVNESLTKEKILTDAGVQARDRNGNIISVSVELFERVDTAVKGNFGLRLNAADAQGNNADQKALMIIIR